MEECKLSNVARCLWCGRFVKGGIMNYCHHALYTCPIKPEEREAKLDPLFKMIRDKKMDEYLLTGLHIDYTKNDET
jgi:hypothetical protein